MMMTSATTAATAGFHMARPRVFAVECPQAESGAMPIRKIKRGKQRSRCALIEGRTDGHLLAGKKLGDEREDHAPEADDQDAHEEQVVEQEERLA